MASVDYLFSSGGFTKCLEYTAGNTFVIPANTKTIGFEMIGGGGGGARNQDAGNTNGGGGGGAAMLIKGVRIVKGGETISIVVGAGGAGATVSGANGGIGGDTYIKIDGRVVAESIGGLAGFQHGAGGSSMDGTMTSSDMRIYGANGTSDGQFSNVNPVSGTNFTGSSISSYKHPPKGTNGNDFETSLGGGAGGASALGAGGNGGDAPNGGAGGHAAAYGAGGGGGGNGNGFTSGNGGNGGNGLVRIWY